MVDKTRLYTVRVKTNPNPNPSVYMVYHTLEKNGWQGTVYDTDKTNPYPIRQCPACVNDRSVDYLVSVTHKVHFHDEK